MTYSYFIYITYLSISRSVKKRFFFSQVYSLLTYSIYHICHLFHLSINQWKCEAAVFSQVYSIYHIRHLFHLLINQWKCEAAVFFLSQVHLLMTYSYLSFTYQSISGSVKLKKSRNDGCGYYNYNYYAMSANTSEFGFIINGCLMAQVFHHLRTTTTTTIKV